LSFVDAHIHLADAGYAGRAEEAIEDAIQHNIAYLLSNATHYESSIQTINLAKRYPGRVLAAVGIHPSTVTRPGDLHLEDFPTMVEENAEHVNAIGEIGLDGKYSREEHIKTQQNEVFRFFLTLAEQRRLPVVIHSRQAVAETLETLADFHLPRILFHWYDGPIENLPLFKERGYFISIGPALLYSRRINEIAAAADLSMVLTETDGPVAYRSLFGHQLTKPSFVIEVVRKLAEVKAMNTKTVREIIFSNFQRFIVDTGGG
jgi:TatD DNase family protein